MGWESRITADLSAPILYHAVGQGALGVEIRIGDEATKKLCESLTHWPTDWTCRAERSMLRVLEGGCSVPVGVHTTIAPLDPTTSSPTKSTLTMTGTVTAISCSPHVEHTLSIEIASVDEAVAAGEKLATILMQTGAKEILEEISKDRLARKADAEKTAEEVANIQNAMEPKV